MPGLGGQAQVSRFRKVQLALALAGRPAPVDLVSLPDIMLSPQTPTGLDTTGFLIFLQDGGAVLPALGVDLTVWHHDAIRDIWASFATVAVAYRQLFVTFDIDAAELFFQFGAVPGAGDVLVNVCEV